MEYNIECSECGEVFKIENDEDIIFEQTDCCQWNVCLRVARDDADAGTVTVLG